MITLIIIAITCLVSILCFNGTLNGNKLLFNAYQVWHRNEWYRMFTSGIIHSGWGCGGAGGRESREFSAPLI